MEDLTSLISLKNDKKAYYDEWLISMKLISHISQ